MKSRYILLMIFVLCFAIFADENIVSEKRVRIYRNGRYEGQLKNNKPHGKGTFFSSNGSKYVGEWKNGLRHGRGIFIWNDGAKYKGQWKNNKEHGKGSYTYANGSKYKGQWKYGKEHGRGIFIWNDGAKYKGQWKHGRRHGKGIYIWNDGVKYKGQWRNGKRNGKGLINWGGGEFYKGQWKDEKQHGKGIFKWSNGKKYKGKWKNGYVSGKNLVLAKFMGASPRDPAKKWALAIPALLNEINSVNHYILGGCLTSKRSQKVWKDCLRKWWGIKSRQDLLRVLEWLDLTGHRIIFEKWGKMITSLPQEQLAQIKVRLKNQPDKLFKIEVVEKYYLKNKKKSILGWDYTRYVWLCGHGYTVGYLTEKEAWEKIMPKAIILQKIFTSWKDLGENYIQGRMFWSLYRMRKDGQRYMNAFKKLLSDPSSPWIRNSWNMNLKK